MKSLTEVKSSESAALSPYEFLISQPAQRIREISEKTLSPLKMTPKQYRVIATLHFEGPSSQRDIGETLKIDRTSMVLLIDELEAKGWVVRDVHPKDRRYYLLNLTIAGKKIFKNAHRLVLNAEQEFLKPLSKKERQSLRQCLSKLLSDLSKKHDSKGVHKMKEQKKLVVVEAKAEKKEKSPYMSKGIYNNYEKSMKEKNAKRKGQGLQPITVRTFEEWSNV